MQVKHAQEYFKKQGASKIVLVASRRTDIPRFYSEELIRGLNSGVFHPQPLMHPVFELRFAPGDIHSIGLWSQDFSLWIKRRHEVKQRYSYWYRFTILPDNPVIKPVAPAVKEQLTQLRELARHDGPEAINVCIDPLCSFRRIEDGSWKFNYTPKSLEEIISGCAQCGIKGITFSIIDYYKKVENRARRHGVLFQYPDRKTPEGLKEAADMAGALKEAAAKYGLELYGCCEPELANLGLCSPGSCVNGNKLNTLFGPGASTRQDSGQRKNSGCRCTMALDIGRYSEKGAWSHHCGHDCPQCYARR